MSTATGDGKESQPSTSETCRHFEFQEILLATKDFDESLVIGHGGFGKVYKGKVTINGGTSSIVVAIKRLDSMSSQGAAEFWAEVEMLSKLRHCNLVSLIGYCNYEKEMILVYEYMPNGTLGDHLHEHGTRLSWIQRLKICIGAGRGLHYLHTGTGTNVGVIHRDVKSSNILLDENWAAKISDFGLSKIGPTNQTLTYVNTIVKGTFGYLDPDYSFTGRLTRKSDVYAFGVVLLELLCRKRAVDRSLGEDQWNLARWAQESIKEGKLKYIIDSDIRSEIFPKCLKGFVRIAERCLQVEPKDRCTMSEVVVGLESLLTLQVKINSSLQSADRTIFGRMLDRFPFTSNRDNAAQGNPKISTNYTGNNNLPEIKEETIEVPVIPNSNLKVFEYSDLERATGYFNIDRYLGVEGSRTIFLGWVDKNTLTPSNPTSGIAVAIKEHVLSKSQTRDKWLEDVNLFGRLSHPNIVNLLGYCIDKEHKYFLVHEYILNGNVADFLFKESYEPLSWGTRLSILIGVARGLTYLHSSKAICCGFKTNDILLDQDFSVKLRTSRLKIGESYVTGQIVEGFVGYMDPYHFLTGHWSMSSDIYSFGALLLETVTGLQIIDNERPSEQVHLTTWARKTELKEILDPRLGQDYPQEGALECAALALRCLVDAPDDRPSSEEILQRLEQLDGVNKSEL